MKKIIFSLMVSILFVSTIYFTSCKKDQTITAVVTVKYLADTTLTVPFAHVQLKKYDVNIQGLANATGQFEHIFRDEAILDVRAWQVDENGNPTKYGETTIRLEKGNTVRKSVFIN
jgi:hypothetical protein